jgi:hypothetical protein
MGTTIAEIRAKGWEALTKELGYAGATKFILLYEKGVGNYTEERKKIFQDTTITDVIKDLKSKRKN